MVKKLLCLFMLVCAIYAGSVHAAEGNSVSIKCGDWRVDFNRESGVWTSLSFDDEFLSENSSMALQTEKGAGEFALDNYDFSEAEKCLTMHFSAGDWHVTEKIEFDACGIVGLLKRSHEFVFTPEEDAEPEVFKRIRVKYKIPVTWKYWLPGSRIGDTRHFGIASGDICPAKWLEDGSNVEGVFSQKAGNRVNPSYGSNAMFLETEAGSSIGILQDIRRDPVKPYVDVKENEATLCQDIDCQGWALPGVPQKNISAIYLRISPKTEMKKAFYAVMPEWYKALDWHPPLDRPDWVYGAALYELYPRFGVDQGLKRSADMIGRASELGFNTLHVMPVQEGRNKYDPRNYYKIDPHAGNPEDLRELVKTGHENGMKVWLDIVPHGGMLPSILKRGTTALWLSYGRTGNYVGKYPHDYKSPPYQKYIFDVADFYMREYGLDGYRIDQPWGSHPNYRRAGFPSRDKVPGNIDRGYFLRSLDEAGGEMPPLEYERASLCMREGGMEMIRQIRNAVKKNRSDGAVHSETIRVDLAQEGDIVYDVTPIWQKKLCAIDVDKFVPALSRYFEEKKILYPPTTRFLRVFQNHDRMNPFNYLGAGLGRAVFAATSLADGASMFFMYSDIGHTEFLKSLNAVRNSRAELQFPEAHYLAVKTSCPKIWPVLRTWKGQCSIGLVNFSNRLEKTRITVAEKDLGLDGKKNYVFANAFDGRCIASGTPKAITGFEIELKPYETIVVASYEPGAEPAPKVAKIPEPLVECEVSVVKHPDSFEVITDNYNFKLDAKTGLPVSFATACGENVLSGSDFLFSRKPEGELAVAKVELQTDGAGKVLTVSRKMAGMEIELVYRCSAKEIKLSAKLTGKPEGEFMAMLLPVENAANWRVNTMEGLLDGKFWALERPSDLMRPNSHTCYRDKGRFQVLWDMETQMLDTGRASVACYGKNGDGFELLLNDPLRKAPANMALFKRVGESRKPSVAVYLYNDGTLALNGKKSFELTLRPASYSSPAPKSCSVDRASRVKFWSESACYVVENDYYRVKISRLGGTIREVFNKTSGKSVIGNQLLGGYSLSFLVHENWKPERKYKWHYTRFDMDAGAKAWLDGSTLHIRFLGAFREGRSAHCHPHRYHWATTEYAFDDSGAFRCGTYLLGDYTAYTKNPVLENSITVGKGIIARQVDNTRLQLQDKADGAVLGTLGEIACGKLNLSDEEINMVVFGEGSDHKYVPFVCEKTGFTFSVDENARAKTPSLQIDEKSVEQSVVIPDDSFELFSSAWLAEKAAQIPFVRPARPGVCFFTRRGDGYFDRSTAAEGQVSLRMGLDFVMSFPSSEKELAPGEYTVSFFMQGKGLKDDASFKLIMVGAGEQGEWVQIPVVVEVKPGDSGWHKVEVPLTLKQSLVAPVFRLHRDVEAAGILWVDDFKVTGK